MKGADGKLHLSKNAKAFHPGQGVYRSSYKNAMRLTRTETNAAYRLADQDRWQRMDFVVGMRVHKSNNHPTEDICDVLAGDYPKTFKFSAWHPQCRCYVTSILCTKEEMMQMQRDILAGKSTNGFRSVNEVRTVPKAFTDWVDANGDRIMRAKALPYFLKDNGKIVDGKWVINSGIKKNTTEFSRLGMFGRKKEKNVCELPDISEIFVPLMVSQRNNTEKFLKKLGYSDKAIKGIHEMPFKTADQGKCR